MKLKSLSLQEKVKVLARMDAGASMRTICAEFDIKSSTFYPFTAQSRQQQQHHEACEVDINTKGDLFGWVSLTGTKEKQVMELRAWCPGGRGIHLRNPPLLPRAVNLRGRRIGKSLAHRSHKIFVPK
ncbi:Nitric oxide-associated protein 1 [Chionoecetes opilio]|uniref:Nitric oxide-associated protein 1 n=1 Tax=Chionoecetes opilio TaxID=41210 RepID=A0A8J5CN36_CHIOP|nr:Nitric oxide-associated protein 1 [Chionoecetes opilio]